MFVTTFLPLFDTVNLTIIKFFDCHGDGYWDGKGRYKDVELKWPIYVTDDNTGTLINGILYTPVTLCNLVPGTYTVVEFEADDGLCSYCWTYDVTANILDGDSSYPVSRTVVVEIETDHRELIFGNTCHCR